MRMRVLTVCTGNLCRSPLAERLLAHRAAVAGSDLVVDSAGTHARNGGDMHPEAVRLLRERGADPTGFATRLLTPRLAAGHDLVLTATRRHRDAVQTLAPALWKKTVTLRELQWLAGAHPEASLEDLPRLRRPAQGDVLDIDDPYGLDREVFDRVGDEIDAAVTAALEFLGRAPAVEG